jgi:hypothetical protein
VVELTGRGAGFWPNKLHQKLVTFSTTDGNQDLLARLAAAISSAPAGSTPARRTPPARLKPGRASRRDPLFSPVWRTMNAA